MWIRPLGQENALEQGMANHLHGECHVQRNLVGYSQVGTELDTTEVI